MLVLFGLPSGGGSCSCSCSCCWSYPPGEQLVVVAAAAAAVLRVVVVVDVAVAIGCWCCDGGYGLLMCAAEESRPPTMHPFGASRNEAPDEAKDGEGVGNTHTYNLQQTKRG